MNHLLTPPLPPPKSHPSNASSKKPKPHVEARNSGFRLSSRFLPRVSALQNWRVRDGSKLSTPTQWGVHGMDIPLQGIQASLASLYCMHHELTVSREERKSSLSGSCGMLLSRGNIMQRYIKEYANDAQQMLTSSICRYCVQVRKGRQDEMALMMTETGKALRALVGLSAKREHSIDRGEL